MLLTIKQICEDCDKKITQCKCKLSPPWCFYPTGYPHNSPGFGIIFKPEKKQDWSFKSKKDR